MIMFDRITRKEWYWVALVSIIVMFFTLLPYIFGYLMTPSGQVFTGIHAINNGDTYSYLSWVEQGRLGHYFFKDLYSSEQQPALFFHPLFLFIGKVASLVHFSNIVFYHARRFIVGLIFLFISYITICYIFSDLDLS